MALESTPYVAPRMAGRVVAIASRFAQPPRQAPAEVAVHRLHGEQDRVLPIGLAVEAHQAWCRLGGSMPSSQRSLAWDRRNGAASAAVRQAALQTRDHASNLMFFSLITRDHN